MNSYLESQKKPLKEFINDLSNDKYKINEIEVEISCKHPLSTFILYLQKHFIAIEDRFTQLNDPSEKNLNSFEKLRNLLSKVDIFDENEFLEVKPKPAQEPRKMKLRRVLSSTFLDSFASMEEFKEKDQIKDDLATVNSNSRDKEEIAHVINPVFGMQRLNNMSRSDTVITVDLKKDNIITPQRAESLTDMKQRKITAKNRFRRLGRSKKELSLSADGEQKFTTVEEENEMLKAKLDSLRLQVQMLSERNAHLRQQNHILKSRNEMLSDPVRYAARMENCKRVTRQFSTPDALGKT